jgi:hypothetical protein
LERAINTFESNSRSLTNDELAELQKQEVISRIRQNANEKALANAQGDALKSLRNKGLVVARVHNPNKSLVIGSLPVVIRDSRKGTSGVWLPLSHDIAVSPGGGRGTERLIYLNDQILREINMTTYRQSTWIAGRSEQLLSSIARAR